MRLLSLVAIILAAGAMSAEAASVYVKTNEAEIRDGERVSSKIIAKAPRGAALTVVQDGKLRVKVRTANGIEGFVARTMVQDAPLSGGKGALGGFVVEDRGPSEMRTAASGRGLMEQAEEMAANAHIDPKAVESVKRMEQLAATINDGEVLNFMVQGGI